jgi:hypothetical protein
MPDGFKALEQTAKELEELDQGRSFLRFAHEWQEYGEALRDVRRRFLRFKDEEWTGETCDKVNDRFDAARTWSDRMADLCEQMAQQAQKVVDAHNNARKQHVIVDSRKYSYDDLIELERRIWLHPVEAYAHFLYVYDKASKKSDEVIAEYRRAAELTRMRPEPGPIFVRIPRPQPYIPPPTPPPSNSWTPG